MQHSQWGACAGGRGRPQGGWLTTTQPALPALHAAIGRGGKSGIWGKSGGQCAAVQRRGGGLLKTRGAHVLGPRQGAGGGGVARRRMQVLAMIETVGG